MALELPIKDVRLQDLRLPEINTKRDLPSFNVPDGVGAGVADVATALHLPGRRRGSRLPLAIGGVIVASLAGWAIANTTVHARLATAVGGMREWLMERWSGWRGAVDAEDASPVAFQAAETAPIRPAPFGNAAITDDAPDYPDGLGTGHGDDVRALEETAETV
jgi:hypothetical protein